MRLIDADKLVKKWEEMLPIMIPDEDGKHSVSLEKAIEILKDTPTVDAEPIVRCEDCQYSNLNGHCMEVGKKYCTIHKRQFHYDFFCSYGERKG